jgi:hypothetical protein
MCPPRNEADTSILQLSAGLKMSSPDAYVAPAAIQAKIRKSVEMSHEQRQRASALLDAAKRAVEIAIEENEAAALKYLGAFL